MFCPQCGHAQPVDGVMFCSSCGFTLRSVQRLLLTGGDAGADVEGGRKSVRNLLNRRGIKQGLVLWMMGAFIVPLLANTVAPDGVIGGASVIFFVGGFLRMLYAWLFQDVEQQQQRRASFQPTQSKTSLSAPTKLRAIAQKLKFRDKPSALPAPAPAATRLNIASHRTTGQLVQPPSVTEHTTRLLNEK